MFPTGVGMNRKPVVVVIEQRYVPHGRGDEPFNTGRFTASPELLLMHGIS